TCALPIYTEVAPGQLGGVFLGHELDLVPVDLDGFALGLDRRLEGAQRGVVLEQVSECFRVADVVDRDDLEVRLQRPGRPIDVAADAPETVDADLECHRASS